VMFFSFSSAMVMFTCGKGGMGSRGVGEGFVLREESGGIRAAKTEV